MARFLFFDLKNNQKIMLAIRKNTLSPFDRTFENFVKDFFNDEDTFNFPTFKNSTIGSTNVKELDDKFVLDLQVPGYKKDNIDINLEDGYLTIKGNLEEKLEENETIHRSEFKKSSFSRTFILPENVNENEIEAIVNDGILTISLNKQEEVKKESKRIEIK